MRRAGVSPRIAFVACIVALSVAPAIGVAEPPRHPGPPPGPARVAGATGDGVLVLRAPATPQVLLRSGTFTMGSDGMEIAAAISLCHCERSHHEPGRDVCDLTNEECRDEWFAAETPAHQVYLSDVWIDQHEVTVAQFAACVAAGMCSPPPFAEGGERFDRPELPVTLVRWDDARTFCAWAGGRLPTEAEWERAARGPNRTDAAPTGRPAGDDEPLPKGRRFPWGDVYNPTLANHGTYPAGLDEVSWLDGRDGFLELAPVGSFPTGRTPDGIDDLAGNVQEWVADWFAEYPAADAANPKGPDAGERRVVRGGSYIHGRFWLRGASRFHHGPGERFPWVGFRCARDAT